MRLAAEGHPGERHPPGVFFASRCAPILLAGALLTIPHNPAGFNNPHNAHSIKRFIERLLLNTVKEARSGDLDEMFDAI